MPAARDWESLAKRIAASRGWIPWVETTRYRREGACRDEFELETSFKVRTEPAKCPHCGGSLGWPNSGYEFVYVTDPRNMFGHASDCGRAWKNLVLDYCMAMRLSSAEELELTLTAKGF